MKKAETLHVGADIPAVLVRRFRRQAKNEGHKRKKIVQILLEFWTGLGKGARAEFYHDSTDMSLTRVVNTIVDRRLAQHNQALRREFQTLISEHLPKRRARRKKAQPQAG